MELVAKATSQAAKQARMMDTTIDVMKYARACRGVGQQGPHGIVQRRRLLSRD